MTRHLTRARFTREAITDYLIGAGYGLLAVVLIVAVIVADSWYIDHEETKCRARGGHPIVWWSKAGKGRTPHVLCWDPKR